MADGCEAGRDDEDDNDDGEDSDVDTGGVLRIVVCAVFGILIVWWFDFEKKGGEEGREVWERSAHY